MISHGETVCYDIDTISGSTGLDERRWLYNNMNRPGVSGHFTSFESESERHVIIEAVKQLSARVA